MQAGVRCSQRPEDTREGLPSARPECHRHRHRQHLSVTELLEVGAKVQLKNILDSPFFSISARFVLQLGAHWGIAET